MARRDVITLAQTVGRHRLPHTSVPKSFKTGQALEVDWDWTPE